MDTSLSCAGSFLPLLQRVVEKKTLRPIALHGTWPPHEVLCVRSLAAEKSRLSDRLCKGTEGDSLGDRNCLSVTQPFRHPASLSSLGFLLKRDKYTGVLRPWASCWFCMSESVRVCERD